MGYGLTIASATQSGPEPEPKNPEDDSTRVELAGGRLDEGSKQMPQDTQPACLVKDSIFTQSQANFKGIEKTERRMAVEKIRVELAHKKKLYFQNRGVMLRKLRSARNKSGLAQA